LTCGAPQKRPAFWHARGQEFRRRLLPGAGPSADDSVVGCHHAGADRGSGRAAVSQGVGGRDARLARCGSLRDATISITDRRCAFASALTAALARPRFPAPGTRG